jgi:hypothetical protein
MLSTKDPYGSGEGSRIWFIFQHFAILYRAAKPVDIAKPAESRFHDTGFSFERCIFPQTTLS